MLKNLTIIISIILLFSCNAPPNYRKNAEVYLQEQGVEKKLIFKLTKYKVLTTDEAVKINQFDNIQVKHMLGCNLSTPVEILIELSKNTNFEVRTGVASNPMTPITILLSMRTEGKYTTVNSALSSNPMIPQNILRNMYKNGETSYINLAGNPNLPYDMMRDIDDDGGNIEIATLASNPSLLKDLLYKYLNSKNDMIRGHAQSNPQHNSIYKRPQDKMLGGP